MMYFSPYEMLPRFSFSRWSGILLTLSKIPKGLARLPRLPYFGILVLCNAIVVEICIMFSSIHWDFFRLFQGYQIVTWLAFMGFQGRIQRILTQLVPVPFLPLRSDDSCCSINS
jgi:hypothetical protein